MRLFFGAIISISIFAVHRPAFAQAIDNARELLNSLDKEAIQHYSALCSANSTCFIAPEKSQNAKSPFKSCHSDAIKARQKLEKKRINTDNKHLIHGYIALYSGIAEYAAFCEKINSVSWPDDSIHHNRQSMLDSGAKLLAGVHRLEQGVSAYCILNRLNRQEDKSQLPALVRLDFQKLHYLHEIQSIIRPVMFKEREFLSAFAGDSAERAKMAFKQAELQTLISSQTSLLKNLPACCGDKHVKTAALSLLHEYAQEARFDFGHLVNFIAAEEQFIRINQKMKDKSNLSLADKETYKTAVRKYNSDIKATNELTRKIENNQNAQIEHLKKEMLRFSSGSLAE